MLYKSARRLVVAVFGVTILILSIVGYVLPVIPGIPLTLLGLAILGTEFIWARRLLKKVRTTAEDFVNRVRGRPQHPVPPDPGPGASPTTEVK